MEIVRERCVIGPLLDDLQSTAAAGGGQERQPHPWSSAATRSGPSSSTAPVPADPAQPARQRGQVHAPRVDRAARRLRARGRRRLHGRGRVTTPAVGSRRTRSAACSAPSTRPTARSPASSAAPASAWRSGRELRHLLGGDIQVKSEVGEGTTFTVRLPLLPMVMGRPTLRECGHPDREGLVSAPGRARHVDHAIDPGGRL